MNLIPLTYQKNQKYRQWIGYSIVCCILIGLMGVSTTCLMPLELLALEKEIECIQKAEVFTLLEERDKLQEALNTMQQKVDVLDGQYSHLQRNQQAFKAVLAHVLEYPVTPAHIVDISFERDAQVWHVIGKHSELKTLIAYEKFLKERYGEDQIILQIEPKEKMWYFSLKLSVGEDQEDDPLV